MKNQLHKKIQNTQLNHTVMNISILGTGNWGTALGKVFTAHNHPVYYGSRTPEQKKEQAKTIGARVQVGTYAQAAAFSDVIILATPWPDNGTVDALKAVGPLEGKILVDATNALQVDFSPLKFEHADSGAEEVVRRSPKARVVKAFNTISGYTLGNNLLRFGDTTITGFYCGDDREACETVGNLMSEAGLHPQYSGPLKNARHLESLGQLLIHLAFQEGLGVYAGFAFLHRPATS